MATLMGLGLCIDDLNSTFGTSVSPPVQPGTMVESDEGKKYMFVYNAGSTSITQYYPAYHTSTTVKGNVGSAGLAAGCVAGVAVTAIGSSEYGWIQIKGYITAPVAAGITTTGCPLIGGTAAFATPTQVYEYAAARAITVRTNAGTIIVDLSLG